MNQPTHLPIIHTHQFGAHNNKGEKRTFYVLLLTVTAMFVEIISGKIFGSMALLADGWHMGTHAAAFCITLFTYRYAKRHAQNEKFSYGTGKVSVLGGFSSAIALGIVALMMFSESVMRLFDPQEIHFNEAILVAIIGLLVNFVSMLLLHNNDDEHHHHHGHGHGHGHSHDHHEQGHHQDHNLRAAYMHVLADTLTSVLAIIALIIGKYVGWHWLDAVMGMVGAIVITKWAIGLLKQTSPILLDSTIDQEYKNSVITAIEPYAEIIDLHIWKVSADHHAASVILKSQSNKSVSDYRQLLSQFDKIHHLTVELHSVESA
ncbi:CDF family Co(II)/Ni(II) efflux transporter DmeF [Vibrio algarum]|uniref:CDF family Co(II)/Ni(II) efflux transporter DmeF n=1 Tax=Vibrio algarum TaxID=3020714 RepID=A0ABT4YVL6_9VIBR|nr:CDF family Co(II)/Ni(II) efflux transporter DmeF [Vibrio sp. KJ40-1]MDB1125621.1 CDF family Co(II)/Ni(II) efflux transporter DmeF [Vibrio sp. KJ40-1]